MLKEKLADHLRHADHVAKSIRIRKSKIKAAGGGAFLTIPVARGALLGFYKGSRVVVDNLVDEPGVGLEVLAEEAVAA